MRLPSKVLLMVLPSWLPGRVLSMMAAVMWLSRRRFEDFTSQNTGRVIAGLHFKRLRSRSRILFLGFIACHLWIMSFTVSRAVVAAVAFTRQGDCVGMPSGIDSVRILSRALLMDLPA